LEYILSHSSLILQAPQIDAFWDSIIVNALTTEERDQGFLWVQNVRNSQVSDLLFSTAQTNSFPETLTLPLLVKQFLSITDESTQYIFEHKVPLMDFGALTQKGFHFFEYFFRYVNWFLKKFDQGENGVRTA